MQFYQVQFRAVAFVLAEAILREARAEVAHNRVARDFRDDARSRNAEAVAIAIDDGGLRQGKGKHRQAIDEDVLGLGGQGFEGGAHRLVGRAQDIDRVDLHRIDHADRPEKGGVREEILVNFLAFLGEELFGIVQLPMTELLRKDDGCSYDWTGQGAAPGFIDARDRGDTERAKFAFMPEATTAIHHRQNTETLKN
jgi:hypothetical protein